MTGGAGRVVQTRGCRRRLLIQLTTLQSALLYALVVLDGSILLVHVGHGFDCWGFMPGGFANGGLVTGLALLFVVSATRALVTSRSYRSLELGLLMVGGFVGVAVLLWVAGADEMFVSGFDKPIAVILLFVLWLNLSILICVLGTGRVERGICEQS